MAPAPLHSSHDSFFYYCECVCSPPAPSSTSDPVQPSNAVRHTNPLQLSPPQTMDRAPGSGFFPRASYSSRTDRESSRCATPAVVLPTSPPSLLHQQGVGHRICLPPICSSFVSFLQLAEYYFEVQ
ncbi:hypothetical protein VPH35_072737 [Triticum aestivum]